MPPWFWTLSAALASAASVASTLAEATWRAAASSPSASATAAKVVSERAASARTAMSAQRCFTAWKAPIGRPNCCRTFAYSTESSSVRSATPTASAAASRVASVRRQDRPEPGARGERAAELDEEEHLLRSAVARPARGLGQAEAEPAEPARLAPERLVDAGLRARDRAHERRGKTRCEHAADRVADRRLLGPERQVHRLTAAARARARR